MKKKGILKQMLVRVIIVLIAFFSLNSVDAASFPYNSFDWNKFYEENVDYWTDYCKNSNGSVSLEDCLEITLSGKKKYYVNLYKILAKYEKKGYKLNDNYLLATTFYYLTPDTFSDLPEEYLRDYIDGSAYALDNDADTYDVDEDLTLDYYEKEKDTIKMLTKHMFAYHSKCDAIIAPASVDENGNKFCPRGTLNGNNCVETIDNYKLYYTEYLIEKLGWIAKLFGFTAKYRKECENKGGIYVPSDGKKVIDYEMYWKFLEKSEYFDEKVHLTTKYSTVLEKSGHKLVKDMSKSEKEIYEQDLIKARSRIVKEIRSVLKDYGETAETPDSFVTAMSTTNSLYWPIGSNETTEENGILFATGSPTSTTITKLFGAETNASGETLQNSGIKIGDVEEGITNVIAVKNGTVISTETSCISSTTKDDCGNGYGNHIIIQHNDGTYSVYGNLHQSTITVKVNDNVQQGQVIGKVGSSGYTTSANLHFEIREGTNSSKTAVNPLTYVSTNITRPQSGSGGSGEFAKMLHHFEGGCASPTNGNNYVIHDDGKNIPTVGYGVALKYNIENFKKYGIDVTNLKIGDQLPINIVDNVESIKVNQFRNYVNNYLAENSITLHEYQVDCLTMVSYQFGNIGNFATVYKEYGNTETLRNTAHNAKGTWYYFKENPSTKNGRAEATWKLFHEGIYTYNQNKC